jgi:thiol:disulfide interchange protein
MNPLAVLLIAALVSLTPVRGQGAAQGPPPVVADAKFDPARDAAKDIADALVEAKNSHRRVILDVGGEWCSWCHTLDRYFVDHPDLKTLRDKAYVWIKVNWSPENKNQAVLSRYSEGEIEAFPWLFVLDQDGKLLQSQRTGPLEQGPSYSYDRMKNFLEEFAPK